MTFRWAKYPHKSPRSKPVLYNSQKNASIRKPVFQNGLRLANGAFLKEITSGRGVRAGEDNVFNRRYFQEWYKSSNPCKMVSGRI